MAPNLLQKPLSPRDNKKREGAPPTQELGAMVQTGIAPWTSFSFDDLEMVPELQFPNSVRTYSAMRNDSQIEGLYAGATWPIRRYRWMIDPNGCDPERVKALAADLNLPVKGDPPDARKPRTKKRFVHDRHLGDALKSLIFGFYMFEQVGQIKDDDGLWHLKKLAPRPPITIETIRLADDGGLLSVRQNISNYNNPLGQLPEIPVDRLVAYVWDQDGANWTGRSMLRAVYRNWLIKDRLLRIDAIKHERNGIGVPVAVGAQGMTDPELGKLSAMAQGYKVGESSGGAIPFGTSLTLEGVRGTLPDTIASINLHNEEMSRRFLMMFLQLGSTLHGSRSLGKDFVDYFQLAQEFVANWYKDIFTEHVIEDYWDWNWDDDHTPRLTYERNDDPRFAAADLALMIQQGVIIVDDELEQAVREAMDLPDPDESTARPLPSQTSPVGDQPGQPSTQPGNADPQFPDQNPTTAKRQRTARADASSPAEPEPSLSENEAIKTLLRVAEAVHSAV